MDIGVHHVAQRRIDHLVAANRADIPESLGHDVDVKVPETLARPGVARVQVRLVLDAQLAGVESTAEELFDTLNSFLVHGSTGMNGLTSKLSKTPSVT